MIKEKSNSERFLAIYNEIDTYMRKKLSLSDGVAHSELIRKLIDKGNSLIRRYSDDLKAYAKLRNAIVHNPYKNQIDPIAEPHDIIIIKYQKIRDEILNPPLALDILAVKAEKIYKIGLNYNAIEVMEEMNKQAFSYVPVIEKDTLIGVFSEKSIFSYIVKNKNVLIDDECKISDFLEFIPLDNHCNECFLFKSRTITVVEIEEVFKNNLIGNKRIAIIFITEKGKENEKILGLITPWDVVTSNVNKIVNSF